MAEKRSELVILIGAPGSGKSTMSKEFPDHFRINQDDQGPEHKQIFKEVVKTGKNIIIDRMNFSMGQRAQYIIPALRNGYWIKIIRLTTPLSLCIQRVAQRKDHPTIAEGDYFTAGKCAVFFRNNFERVRSHEYDEYLEVNRA